MRNSTVSRVLGLATALAPALTTTACGGDPLDEDDDTDAETTAGSADKGSVVVGGQDFTESQVMAAIYQLLLEDAGYTVETKLVTTRDVYLPELSNGKVDIVPDYLAGHHRLPQHRGQRRRTPTRSRATTPTRRWPPSSRSPRRKGISILPPSDATDQNAFFVTKEFADENDLKTLSDLAALGEPIKLGAPPDCEGRADCEGGLTDVYGFEITEIVPLDFGSAQVKDAVKNGEVQLGETGTTDGTLDDLGLELLEDDQGIQPAQNLTPGGERRLPGRQPRPRGHLQRALRRCSPPRTSPTMNAAVDVERQKPEDVAQRVPRGQGPALTAPASR